MPTNLLDCPDSQTLADFLLGKLPTDAIDNCRQHLVDCDPCVETIRGLKVDGDTIHELSRKAWLESVEPSIENTESQVVNDLIGHMEELSVFERLSKSSPADGTEARAAEVQRLLKRPIHEDELGQLGKYRIRQLLGAGSTGVVYLAIDEDLDRTVALKILRPSLGDLARERFVAEAKATAMLQHPNVVQIYEVGVEGPLAFISMMWEPGQTLERMLELENSLPIDSVRELGTTLANTLAHAHQRGLIHRDIKPANIWIPDKVGMAGCKVLDFGLVRITDADPLLTCTGMIAGTPCYMSPEQSRGQQLDGRSDLFSLGCVLYQALTGTLPFRSDNALSTLQSIQRDHPAEPMELDPCIPPDLSDLVMCLLEKSPNRRPPTAESVGLALTRPRSDWPFEVKLSPPSISKPKSKPAAPSRIWKLVAAGLIGLALGVLGLMFGPQITRIVTNHGVIEIDCKVDDVKIEIMQNGEQIRVIDLATEESVELKAGMYEIRSLGNTNSVQIENNKLTLTRGGKAIVTITRGENLSSQSTGMRNELATGNQPDVDLLGQLLAGQNSAAQLQLPSESPSIAVPYRLAAGDVLGIFVEGVLGQWDSSPPVHMPPPGSRQPPTMGYPILVEENGRLSLPLIEPISVSGKTLSEAKDLVAAAYQKGENPILKEDARILVTMMRTRNPQALPSLIRPLGSGDVLGVFIPGVLGEFNGVPPVHMPANESNLIPSMGYPIVVDEQGQISLPLVPSITVGGKTLPEARLLVIAAFVTGEEPLLRKGQAQIIVTLIRKGGRIPEAKSQISEAAGKLQKEIRDLKSKLRRMTSTFGPGHKEVRILKEELQFLEQELNGTPNEIDLP